MTTVSPQSTIIPRGPRGEILFLLMVSLSCGGGGGGGTPRADGQSRKKDSGFFVSWFCADIFSSHRVVLRRTYSQSPSQFSPSAAGVSDFGQRWQILKHSLSSEGEVRSHAEVFDSVG